MPNSLSAEKRLRQNKVRQSRNKAIKSAMKTQIKKVVAAAESGDVEAAETEFKLAAKKLDQAGAKNCLLYTSPSPRDQRGSRMPSSA